jgi:hypothetical protein
VRAGLLSEPRVIALLRTVFVPVHVSALNTPHCMRDPRDVELLTKYVSPQTDDFDGGEREAFVLPDGTMQTVFLSLSGHAIGEYSSKCSHYTAAGRRADEVSRCFRHYGAIALRAVQDELPEAWHKIWDSELPEAGDQILDGENADVAAIEREAPRWPEPPAGRQGFRVFVRNSYRMYDDLHGAQLALLDDGTVTAWGRQLEQAGSRAPLPRAAFVALAQAMVPRGMVDTELDPESIAGELELVATAVDGRRVTGTIEGSFGLKPKNKSEVGKRDNAAVLFESTGRLVGRFVWDRDAERFEDLRIAAADVQFAWKPDGGGSSSDFAPRHQVGIEWVRGPASVVR